MKKVTNQRPLVVSRHGKYRFQTGMITAQLLDRGLPMEAAFSISRALRNQIMDRSEITSTELDKLIEHLLEERGYDLKSNEKPPASTLAGPLATTDAPLAQHLLLRDLVAVGMNITQASKLVRAFVARMQQGGDEATPDQLDTMMTTLLDEAGPAFSPRYSLIRYIRQSSEPIVLFIGGATGTGKSTLAMELAFRLGIRMAVSTDMIRETMRTVLSADVVPGLHDHSFRGMLQGGAILSDPRERVVAGFRQQAAQVAVGVRAVVRRALREHTHMVVEGTHLLPPFARYLPVSDVNHAGLILAVPEASRHRQRFPSRASQQPRRDASAYLDAFQSVRWIHDDLLSAAEETEALVLSTGEVNQTALSTMDYLAQALPLHEFPKEQKEEIERQMPRLPTLFLILDGLSDEPHGALQGETPLQAAHTPHLRMLAESGGQGQIMTAPHEGDIPHTDEGLWSLLGAEMPTERIGRGVYEAVGQGIPLTPGAIFLRGNLATCHDDGSLIDRRAGRISYGQADLLAGLRHVELAGGLAGSIYAGHEHRVVVMLRGMGLSDQVSDTDPGSSSRFLRYRTPRPTDASPEAARTAAALRELLDKARTHLDKHPHNLDRINRGLPAANCVITRGAASTHALPPIRRDGQAGTMVAACTTALGVARLAGMRTVTGPTMTGNLETDLTAKFDAAANALKQSAFVVIHFKGTDIAAHDRRPLAKRDYIAAIDAGLGSFFERYADRFDSLRVVVSADHGTSSVTGNHLPDPVPVLIATWTGPGEENDFDEISAAHGALGLLQPGDLSQILWAS